MTVHALQKSAKHAAAFAIMLLYSEAVTVTPILELLLAPLERGNARFHQLLDVLELCRDGIARTPHVARYAEAWDNFLSKLEMQEEDGSAKLEYIQKLAAKASTELTLGFPTLHSHVLVSLWSIVENTIEDFVVEWIKCHPQFMSTAQISKVKISLGEYMRLDEDEKTRYLLSEIKQQLGCGSALGIEKFEKLLNLCELGGPVDDDLRKNLIELSEIRNVIVHRSSSADRKLLQTCRWLPLKPNERIAVDRQTCDRYVSAVDRYMANVLRRIAGDLANWRNLIPSA